MATARLLLPVLAGVSVACARTPEPTPLSLAGAHAAAPAADTLLPRAALVADVRELVALLEAAHPDPYARGGGRIAFHRRVHQVLDALPAGGMTARQLLRRLRPLVASVRDGHTQLGAPWQRRTTRRTWVELDAVGERLLVSGVYRAEDRPALGRRLAAVAGVSWPELVRRMAAFRGADNAYNNLDHLSQAISRPEVLEDLLGRDQPLQEVRVELEPVGDGTRTALALPVGPPPAGEALRPPSRVTLPAPDAADLAWGFLTEDRSVAVLRIDSMMRYREAFEVWRSTGFVVNLTDHLREVAQRASGQRAGPPLPEGVDARIALVPSATETFGKLFSAMRDARTRALVVDLRRNAGGNSAMNLILGYFLYPLDRLVETDEGFQVLRFSRLYFETHRSATLGELRARRWLLLETGDLDFSEEAAWQDRKKHGLTPAARARRLRELTEDAARLPTFQAELRTRKANAAWSGKVVVLTSGQTYSAGFDLVALLVKHGATVVGVPSAQAGNCFIDGLPFRLARSGLEGTISYKQSLMFPDQPARGELLRPDVELTYERLSALGFDPNASVLLALEALGQPSPARATATPSR